MTPLVQSPSIPKIDCYLDLMIKSVWWLKKKTITRNGLYSLKLYLSKKKKEKKKKRSYYMGWYIHNIFYLIWLLYVLYHFSFFFFFFILTLIQDFLYVNINPNFFFTPPSQFVCSLFYFGILKYCPIFKKVWLTSSTFLTRGLLLFWIHNCKW